MAVTGFMGTLSFEVGKVVDMIFGGSIFYFILICAVGGMVVFGLHYLLYMFTEKYKNIISTLLFTVATKISVVSTTITI